MSLATGVAWSGAIFSSEIMKSTKESDNEDAKWLLTLQLEIECQYPVYAMFMTLFYFIRLAIGFWKF